MLTCKTVTPERAVDYFLQGYYLEGTSRWQGKGAEKLGLLGAVSDEQVFTNIVNGLSPDGTRELSKRRVESKDRRAALDCTFSAPKSVSLTALVGGDERLIKAHHLAVEKTLNLMQERYAHTRVTIDQERQIVNTRNLVFAEFDHIETRELDPHLHTHCLCMNMTQLDNGSWYSHLNEAIYANKKFLGMAYQSALALEVQKLGYEIEPKGHGQFDIKGYTSEQLMDFSKRRKQILAAVGASSSWAEREKAWDVTRKRKQEVKPEELKAKWREEAAALGITFVKPGSPQQELMPQQLNSKSLEQAIAHCSERTVAFKQEDLEKFLLSEELLFDIAQLEPLIRDNPELIRIQEENGIRFTTQGALQRELATIRLMQDGQGQAKAIALKEVVENRLASTTLNEGQREAVHLAVTTKDSFIAWQGVAGAGKTFALKEVQAIATKQGYTVKGFAPSAEAAKVLGEDLETETETVARLLVSELPEEVQLNQIWVVDEAGLLSAKDACRLLERATQEQARVILVGDTRQLTSVEAGNPFKSLQQAGMTTAYLEQSLRQRTPELKLAVDLIASGKVEAGFAVLSTNGCIPDFTPDSKVDVIAAEYMSATPEERVKTLVLAGTNAERLDITQAIRSKLKAEGSLGQEANITQVKAKDLTTVQMGYTHHFEIGDVVMPMRNYKRRGLEKGELYEVVDKSADSLTLIAADGQLLQVDTGFSKAVYKQQQIEIAVGDRCKWTKNDRSLVRRNGQEFTVTAVSGDSAEIQYIDGGLTETINLTQAQHLDYALVSTTYSSQGKTADRVLISADYTIGQESFYVAVSRAKHDLKLYTEDKAYLLELAQQPKAKENPLELLRQQVKERVSFSPFAKASQPVNQPSVTEKPHKEPKEPPTSVNTQLPSPLIKGTTFQPKQTRPSNRKIAQQPYKPPTEKEVDVATVFKAANRKLPNPPDWLVQGKRVHCQSQGWGEVEALIGPHLIVNLDSGEQAHILEWPDAIKSKRVVPEIKAFWTPGSAGVAPDNIETAHWFELVEGSAINPELASCNVETVAGNGVYERLLSTRLEKIGGSGQYVTRPAAKLMQAYEQVASGGWWAKAGIDARSLLSLTPGSEPDIKLWGSFKADNPRVDADKSKSKGKTEIIKYEHPLGEERQLFLFEVPAALADRIYSKHGIQPTEAEKQSGFWYVAYKYNLPITVTEGAKKTLSSLSQGEATIGLSGVNGGYLTKDQDKNRLEQRELHPELKVFATPGREFRFAFDQDTKLSTIFNVRREMVRTGELLDLSGCTVRVVQWKGDKGLDDLIVNQSPLAYTQAQANAIPLAREAKKHYRSEYTRLEKQVRNFQPDLPILAIDIEVYKLAVSKGDIRDGARVIAQSNQARSFQAELLPQEADEKILAYIQRIEQQIYQATKTKTVETEEQETPPEQLLKSRPGSFQDVTGHLFPPQTICEATPTTSGCPVLSVENVTPEDQQRANTQDHSQPKEKNDDINPGQFRAADNADSLSSSDDRAYTAERKDRAVRGQPYETDRENHSARNQPNREFERLESQSHELLEAISRYVEFQEVEQLGADIARINQGIAGGWFRGQGAAELARAVGRQNPASVDSTTSNGNLEQQDGNTDHRATRQLLNAIADFVETAAIQSLPITNNLQTLTENLNRGQYQDRVMQKLLTLLSNHLEQSEASRQATAAIADFVEQSSIQSVPVEDLKFLSGQLEQYQHQLSTAEAAFSHLEHLLVAQETRDQVKKAIANHLEEEAIADVPLTQALQALMEKLTHLQGADKINNQNLLAITRYIEQEATDLEILPALKNLVAQLNTLPPGEFLSLVPASPEPEFPEQLPSTITSFIEQVAVESEITFALKDLTKQLTQLQPGFTNLVEPLDTAISNELQRLEAVSTSDQQETRRLAVEALSKTVEHEAVESALDSQTLQTLSNQLFQLGDPESRATMQRIEAIVADGKAHLQAQALTTAVKRVAEAIVDSGEQTAINEAIALVLEAATQSLSLVGESQIPEQLQQFSRAIEQYQEHLETQQIMNQSAVDSFREIPLLEVAQRLGLEQDRLDKHKWRSEGQIISINNQKFYDHLALKGGYGAIDLVMHVQGRSFKEAVTWLSNGATYLPLPQQLELQQKAPPEQKPFQPPVPDEPKWAAVRQYLIKERRLPEALVDALHHQGVIYADSKQNAVFVRKNIEGEATGASLRGTYKDSQFKGLATGTRRDQGWFSFTQGEGQLERIVLVESPIDAISASVLASKRTGATMFMSIDGAGATPLELLRQHEIAGMRVVVGYDADPVGEEMARIVMEALPEAVRVRPTYGKDWNEQLVNRVATIEALNHLGDRDFLQLHQDVSNYFKATPPEPPSLADRQLVESEIDKLTTLVNDLWSNQTSQVALVESMQLQPFSAWNKKYEEAVKKLETTMETISASIAQKDQKENQLKAWSKQSEIYQKWEQSPRTIEMRSLGFVLKMPQMQERLANIKQELQRQKQELMSAPRQTRQQEHQKGLSL